MIDPSGRFDAVVVGGGISGLVTAFELQQRGRSVALVDAGTEPGGVIASRRDGGYLYETGANSTLDTTPLVDRLLGALGIRDERVNASKAADKRFLVRNGRLVALPTTPSALLVTRAFTTAAKLRLLREPFIPRAPADADESIAAFVRRRLGREFLDYAVDPFVSGVYAGDPERISVRAAFPRLHALEQRHGSLLRGQIAGARERRASSETPKNVARSFSMRNGMQALPRAIAGQLANYFPGTRVLSIDVNEPSRLRVYAQGLDLATAAIVLAVPADAAAALVAPLSSDAVRSLHEIEYAPVSIVASAYRRADVAHPLDGFGFLAPRVERRAVLGCLFSSSIFPGRAPDGCALFTTFIGGQREPQAAALNDAELSARSAAELAALVGARAPQWTRIVRWPRAIPQYTIGHVDRVAAIDRALAHARGLFPCASWRGGVAVGDCIASAHDAAARVDAYLHASTRRATA